MQQTICDLCKRVIVDGDHSHVTVTVTHPPQPDIRFDYHSGSSSPCWETVTAAMDAAKPPTFKT